MWKGWGFFLAEIHMHSLKPVLRFWDLFLSTITFPVLTNYNPYGRVTLVEEFRGQGSTRVVVLYEQP